MTSNCSFRITRTTEDLAQTIIALSQRLVNLEQRFELIENQLKENHSDLQMDDIQRLDEIDESLKACQELLGAPQAEKTLENDSQFEKSINKEDEILSSENLSDDENWIEEEFDKSIAA